ncbi:hypothetical protein GCM10023222_33650 [Saccharopolyspora cebuensis]
MNRAKDGLEIVAIPASGCDPVTGVCHIGPADGAEADDQNAAGDAPGTAQR